jgi:hypothetical protein
MRLIALHNKSQRRILVKKLVLFLFSIILSISMFLPAAGEVLADSAKKPEIMPARHAELMIRMAESADVGQPVAITVYTKHNHNTVGQAMVYALKSSQLAITADISNYSTTNTDYADMALKQGIFIGYTDDDGKIDYRFPETGKYMVIAIKDGYIPGVDSIVITVAAENGLFLRGPDSTVVGKQVVFKVTERDHGIPVENAAMYARKIGDISGQAVVDANVGTPYEVENADEIKANGIFMGYSNNGGIVRFEFEQSGYYVLVAIKEAYSPGFARLTVRGMVDDRLIIRAANRVEVDDEVPIGVFSSNGGQAVEGAGVYVLQKEEATPVSSPVNKQNQDMVAVQSMTDTTSQEYIEEVKTTGNFIGYTDDNGEITHVFTQSGTYILVALKDGYIPARHMIIVTLANQSGLTIRAPESAQVEERVTIAVADRETGESIADAAVYAMKGLNIVGAGSTNKVMLQKSSPVPSVSIPVISASPSETETSIVEAYRPNVEEVKQRGILLGYTDDTGELTYAFNEPGRYVLVAVKDGYNPGFSRINIGNNEQNYLGIRLPKTAVVNQDVTITVFERNNLQPVESAAVYALKMDLTVQPETTISDNGTATQIILEAGDKTAEKYVDEALQAGVLIGYTDDNGQVSYSFTETGRYIITASKDGYHSAFARISILLSMPDELGVKLPSRAKVDEQVSIKVVNRLTQNAEEGASVYALDYTDTLKQVSPSVSAVNETDQYYRAESYAELARSAGIYIGDTDSNGEVTYAFTSSGRYVIVAVKEGFIPGFNNINILGIVNGSLLLRVDDEVEVGEMVTMATIDRNTGESVANVDIYAYKIDGFAASMGLMFREAFSFGSGARQNLAISVSEEGFYIGSTDESGILDYSFGEEGRYLLIAFKSGYGPDFERLNVIPAYTNDTGGDSTGNSPQ